MGFCFTIAALFAALTIAAYKLLFWAFNPQGLLLVASIILVSLVLALLVSTLLVAFCYVMSDKRRRRRIHDTP